VSAPGSRGHRAGDRPEDDGAPEPIGAAADSPEAILAGLAVLWEVDIGDTPLAVTFDPAAPPC
jgi:hypothetical protein